MKYEIIGEAFPAVKCMLEKGETVKCEGGSMSWMDRGITMSTEGGGGLGKALGRAVSGEKIFFNHFKCEAAQGEIAFSSSFPGRIIPVTLAAGQKIIAQKDTNPTVASLMMCLESVFAVLTGALVLGERMSPREAIGCGVMFVAVVLAQLSPLLKKKPA